jgi:hypothetical protein
MAIAYIVMMIIPTLSRYQAIVQKAVAGSFLGALRDHIYIVVRFLAISDG